MLKILKNKNTKNYSVNDVKGAIKVNTRGA